MMFTHDDLSGERPHRRKAAPNGAEETGLDIPIIKKVCPADWGDPAPPRRWIIENYIPARTVTLLYADGGVGKSYLKLQLAVARALGREWIGLMPEPGKTLVFSTEDDIDEMHRRIESILPFYGAGMAELRDIQLVDLVGENVLGVLTKGLIRQPQCMRRWIR
jgi:RecA-family ATPase